VRGSIEKSLGVVRKQGVAWLRDITASPVHHGGMDDLAFQRSPGERDPLDPSDSMRLTRPLVETIVFPRFADTYAKQKNGWVESTYIVDEPVRQRRRGCERGGASMAKSGHVGARIEPTAIDEGVEICGTGVDRTAVEGDEATTLGALLGDAGIPRIETSDCRMVSKTCTELLSAANRWISSAMTNRRHPFSTDIEVYRMSSGTRSCGRSRMVRRAQGADGCALEDTTAWQAGW